MQEQLTLKQAVERFGNEKQKEAIIKNNGNLKPTQFNALIKTIKQHYESVTVEGRGRGRIITCSGKYDVEMAREDKRKENGAEVPYGYEMNSLVLDYVLNNCKNNPVTMSLTQWLLCIGLVDWKIVNASKNDYVRQQHLEMLKEKYNNKFTDKDIVMLQHFIEHELDRLRSNLASVFHKLAQHKIIIHTVEKYGCQLNNEHRALTKLELKEIANMKRELCKKHEITLKDLRFKTKNSAVIAYKKDYEEGLKELGFKYIYDSHGCIVQVSDKIIDEYIDQLNEKDELVICYGLSEDNIAFMINDFKRLYAERSLELAGNRQNNKNKSDHRHIKQLKALKEYLPMWEMLLIFYGLTNYREPKYIDIDEALNDNLANF
ncbi:hypothetical protein ACNR9V_15455 [Parageobacillus thermoglucosidasius]|uniref:hypothetical protein n=1 Tax=Parageobacillus thermoglucosidasius TaxID=1426 RepID=UPI003B670C83